MNGVADTASEARGVEAQAIQIWPVFVVYSGLLATSITSGIVLAAALLPPPTETVHVWLVVAGLAGGTGSIWALRARHAVR